MSRDLLVKSMVHVDAARRALEGLMVRAVGEPDLTGGQAMIIYGLGAETSTIGNVQYTGTNISYNIKKLHERGYISYTISAADRRRIIVALTDKGRKARDLMLQALDAQIERQFSPDEVKEAAAAMRRLEMRLQRVLAAA